MPDQPMRWRCPGLALGRLGQGDEAIEALRRAVQLKPDLPDAWRALGDHYTALEMREAADAALRAVHPLHSTRDPKLMSAALALAENRIPEAEARLREHLKRHPTDVAAIRMLAEVAARIGRMRRRGNPAGALPRARAGLHGRAPELRDGAAPAEQAGRRRWRRSSGCWPTSRAIPGIAISRRRSSAASATTTTSIAHYRAVLADYPQPAASLDEPRPRAKTAGRTAREHRRLPALHRAGAALRRGVVEPRQSQDVPFHARTRSRRCARSSSAPTSRNDDRFHFRFRARQGAGRRAASTRIRSSTTRAATRCAAS